jgi:hypothetical protein
LTIGVARREARFCCCVEHPILARRHAPQKVYPATECFKLQAARFVQWHKKRVGKFMPNHLSFQSAEYLPYIGIIGGQTCVQRFEINPRAQ